MTVKRCKTCENNRSPLDFSLGQSTCKYCDSLRYEESKMTIPVESFKVIRSAERPTVKRAMSISDIDSIICSYFNLPFGSLQQDTRKREIVEPRQLAMYFAKEILKHSYATIGAQLAEREHATAMSARKNVTNLCDTNIVFRKHKEYLEKKINKFQKELNKN